MISILNNVISDMKKFLKQYKNSDDKYHMIDIDTIKNWRKELKSYRCNIITDGWEPYGTPIDENHWYIVRFPSSYQIVSGLLLKPDIYNYPKDTIKYAKFYPDLIDIAKYYTELKIGRNEDEFDVE